MHALYLLSKRWTISITHHPRLWVKYSLPSSRYWQPYLRAIIASHADISSAASTRTMREMRYVARRAEEEEREMARHTMLLHSLY